jgi:tRNA (guanosine-2'-O-)-methyltransferase
MTPERKQRIDQVLDKRQPDLTVLLENVFDPHNIAAVLRTCDAVGIVEAFAITDRIPHRKAWGFRSSRSASKWVKLHYFEDRETCLTQIRARYDRVLGAAIGADIPSIYDANFTGSAALVFGNEKYGLSPEMMEACDGFFHIPQQGMIHSLNISVACAVTLYEAMRQRSLAGMYERPSLHETDRRRMFLEWSSNQDMETSVTGDQDLT